MVGVGVLFANGLAVEPTFKENLKITATFDAFTVS
jgi:hypothetical protein